ncbi:MAG TPA: ABC transporter substrate-binding protein [Thermomicrobiales bacterium]|nr:ABC transporter substrate-binding protein [Thermomicrobiales bacterium]
MDQRTRNVWNLAQLEQLWTARGLDRRDLLKLVGAGAGMTALTTLVTAPSAALAQDGASQVTIEWAKPRTLGPLFSTAGSEQQVERVVFGTLVTMNNVLETIPDMATAIEVSDDATEYTFSLNEAATFNDGTPLTSADVLFTIERAVDTRTASFWKGRFMGLEGAAEYADQTADTITGLTAPDDYTVVMKLSSPDSAFLPTLADFSGLGILPKHILESVAPEALIDDAFNLAPTVGAGPYNFVTYETDQYLELEANPGFWGEAPAVQKIFMRILLPDVAVAELEAGTVDVIAVSIDDMERLSANPQLTIVSIESPSLDSISFNLEREYFQDVRVRQAMQMAIDRENIAANLYQGQAIVRNSPIFGPEWMGVPEGLNEWPFDPDGAKALLEEAGWDPNLEVEMMYGAGQSSTFQAMVAVIQQQWADVGIKANLLQLDSAELVRKLVTEPDYDLYIGGGGVYGAEPSISAKYYITANFTPGGANNVHYSNPDLDELYAQGRAVATEEERKAIYTEIAQILNTDLPSIFLWSPNTNFAINNRLLGFEAPAYVNNRLWNAEVWSVEG